MFLIRLQGILQIAITVIKVHEFTRFSYMYTHVNVNVSQMKQRFELKLNKKLVIYYYG